MRINPYRKILFILFLLTLFSRSIAEPVLTCTFEGSKPRVGVFRLEDPAKGERRIFNAVAASLSPTRTQIAIVESSGVITFHRVQSFLNPPRPYSPIWIRVHYWRATLNSKKHLTHLTTLYTGCSIKWLNEVDIWIEDRIDRPSDAWIRLLICTSERVTEGWVTGSSGSSAPRIVVETSNGLIFKAQEVTVTSMDKAIEKCSKNATATASQIDSTILHNE